MNADLLLQRVRTTAIKLSRRDLVALARLVEEAGLGVDSFSDNVLEVYKAVLENSELCNRPGVEEFIAGLFTDFDRLSTSQREKVLSWIQLAASYSRLPDFAFAIGDFVARKYLPEVALSALEALWDSGNVNARRAASAGARVLLMQVSKHKGDTHKFLVLESMLT